MIAQFEQGQRKGKTAAMVACMLWLMGYGGYAPSDCCGNQTIHINGYTKFSNEQILFVMKNMIKEHVKGKVVMIAEADRAFPPRFWQDKKQTNALIGLWQDEKCGNWFLYDCHFGGVDVLLERATQIYIVPEYIPYLDTIYVEIISKINLIPHMSAQIENVSERVFPFFDTHEPVD